MGKFFDYIQPSIIQVSDDSANPEELRGRYMVNVNIFGIDYFTEEYIETEETDADGNSYLMLERATTDENYNQFESEEFDAEVLDLPRLYIVLTDTFVADDAYLKELIIKGLQANSLYGIGTDNYKPGTDYYINETLYNYLNKYYVSLGRNDLPAKEDICLYNYLDYNSSTYATSITKYWNDLSDTNTKDYTNIKYYYNKNSLLDNTFTEDELNNFYSTFCKIILSDSTITDKSSTNNQIYDLVLNYYAGFQSDSTSIALNLILNSLTTSSSSTSTSCGCNTEFNTTGTVSTSCYDLYKTAMATYLKQMLGDSQFYKDWMNIDLTDCDEIPNKALTDKLIKLIEEFADLDYTLDFSSSSNTNCCPSLTSNDTSDCNYTKLANYIKVLTWVGNDQIDANINKIKIYGQQFGELLPYLQF